MESSLLKVISRIFVLSIPPFIFGCQSPINVLYPPAGSIAEPVTHVTVRFTENFKPNQDWDVYFDSKKITNFSPTPAPGVTSTASIVMGKGYIFGPDQGDVGAHNVQTHATCGFFCAYPGEKVVFFPPALIHRGHKWIVGHNVVEFVPTLTTVYIQNPAPVPIDVTVIDETKPTPMLRLGATAKSIKALGEPIVVTIPQGSDKVTFYVQSAVPAPTSYHPYDLGFTAKGVTPGYGIGNVMAPP